MLAISPNLIVVG